MFSEMSVFTICRGRDNFCENLRSENLSSANDGADPACHRGEIFLKTKYLHSAAVGKKSKSCLLT